ncbi:arylamine N-acetyltransferase family protein [Hyphococcus luteus]|nr:arylamine N-acetyltransferase [Marinicaulis flavus]
MDISAYFDRIGYRGAPRVDLATLKAVHRAHVLAIPFENLDVQFGVPVSRSAGAVFDKLVTRRRGGWCYEMNGLLGWALEEIGFKVARLAAAVDRENRGDSAVGNHLALMVTLDEPWLADAGFGKGLIEPVPLKQGPFDNGFLPCRLDRIEGGWWRYRSDPQSEASSFDLHPDMREDALLENRCAWLQSNEASPFVQNAVVQRWREGEHLCLRGRVLLRHAPAQTTTEMLESEDAFMRLLKDKFDLDLPEAAALWPKICARHDALFSACAN